MGFFSKFFGRSATAIDKGQPVPLTALALAQALFNMALDRRDGIDQTLAEADRFSQLPGVRHSDPYSTELFFFALAPTDHVLRDLSQPEYRRVRQLLHMDVVKQATGTQAGSTASQWLAAMDQRFSEYSGFVQRGDLQGLGARAAAHIGLGGDLLSEIALAGAFTSALNPTLSLIESCRIRG